jgi:MFS family permease
LIVASSATASSDASATAFAPPKSHTAGPWLAALAIVPILATVYQTLVLTDLTDDVIRDGIGAGNYNMIWTNVAWGVAILYGVFVAIWAMPRYGGRDTLVVGLIWFAAGNLFCGAATDVSTLAAAKLVEGIGKGLVIVICRSLLYRQFQGMVIWAMVLYGVLAYATRPTTPLVTALVNDAASWRWIFWVNVPLALLTIPLVRLFVKPDRPPQPRALPIAWGAVTVFGVWVVSLTFACGWYRKWGGWTSNAFAATMVLVLGLPAALVAGLAAGSPMGDHLRRMFRVRSYVLAMCVRVLLLVQLLAVLSVVAKYCLELRDYPRDTTGWILAPATPAMVATTALTFWFRPRALRHVWLLIGVIGCAGSLWWMSSFDAFTSKQQVALAVGCWGLFLGLLPPVFLQDEVEGLDPRDATFAGALALVCMIVPLVVVPTATSTVVSEWIDRAAAAQRLNLRENDPELETASLRIADYYRQHGVEDSDVKALTSNVLGGAVKQQAATIGIQYGFRFLSITVGSLGLLIAGLLLQLDKASLGNKNHPV